MIELNKILKKQGVALMGRSRTSPAVQCRPPDRPRVRPGGGGPPTLPAAGPTAALQTTTTDVSEQNNTGPLGGPVIILGTCAHGRNMHGWKKAKSAVLCRPIAIFGHFTVRLT